ncbi:MAG: hypothetical protein AVDCRST_MAG42-167 [uncultured Chthoniobacterales bacterium]|uniref:Uncharacterized protein n=1 Tax=uncultured Chthoniobacterales bacterium TaxID=1836801 RepID=A0A6J4H6W5_9BACT|nr:MAG: hypothetical protein AVDCRST_MAG42-167 [uncultured Chthoniobacterales bacterium]
MCAFSSIRERRCRCAKHLAGHDVVTAFGAGWSALSNGELLAKAEEPV